MAVRVKAEPRLDHLAVQGLHLTADLSGCSPEHPWMCNAPALAESCRAWVRHAGLNAVSECFHAFSPANPGQLGGVTGMVLLAESHLAVHTWPERGAVTLDVFVCNLSQDNSDKAHALMDALIRGFEPSQVHRQALRRGMPASSKT
jgi:S-adenosylmethionine decarboxylase